MDKFIQLYQQGETGAAVFSKMKEQRKTHRRGITLTTEQERMAGGEEDTIFSKMDYPRDRQFHWQVFDFYKYRQIELLYFFNMNRLIWYSK